MEQSSIVIGTAYYPEHWPKERWLEDTRKIQESGITTLRLAELAELQPQADAAYEEEQRLRQQRKDMRAERSALKDELAALQEQAAASGEDNTRTAEAIIRLYEALAALESIAGLTE